MKVIKNAVMSHQLTLLRDKRSNSLLFRSCIKSIAKFMCYEVTKNLKIEPIGVITPICAAKGYQLSESVVLIPILRAGLGIVDAFREMIPKSRIGHIGIYHDKKTKKYITYYCKIPSTIKNSVAIILDPMLATGRSIAITINILKKYKPKKIKVVSIFAAPEGIKFLEKKYKDVEFYTAAIDQKLDAENYIVPGCGDAGDRIFGTK